MDFRFSAEDLKLREEAIAFTKKEWTPGQYDPQILVNWDHQVEEADQAINEFEKKLVKQGWWTMHWPEEFGGKAAGIETQMAYREGMVYAGAPASLGGGLVAPVLMVAGQQWQKDYFLPKMASAEMSYVSQGFSEPDSGSDLASLKTRAVKEGDNYVINGQKIWSTYRADWMHILTRTDTDAPKHRGITYLLMPLKDDKGDYLPGITVNAIPDALGRHRWDEIFLEDVKVPANNIIGEENRGWYAAMTTLSFERSNIEGPAMLLRILEQFIDYCHEVGKFGEQPLGNPVVRNQLANLRLEIETMRTLSYRVGWMQSKGDIPVKEASMTKFWGDTITQKVYLYLSSELNKRPDDSVGTIAIDAIFNPIKNVSWDVEPIASSIEEHEKLLLQVTSDGSTTPKDAINHAAKIMNQHVSYFMFDDASAIKAVNNDELNETLEVKSILLKSIDEMELSVRSHNCLQAAGIETIGELVSKEESEMLKYKNFGRKSLTELGEKLDQLGLKFGMDISSYIEE